ncbi:MAG: DNA primase [Oscillospiraceae bacterium]|jgi:DNA primase|nr:DNA primase [Oscillospiraceae bacterium]
MTIPEGFLDELTQKTDLAELIGGYVKLSKRGGGDMFGLCPFHSEKTPSFSVNIDKQMYYCFGCGKGGGAINFVMEIENLTFPDAVEFLARRAGLAVPSGGGGNTARTSRRRLLDLNRDAARFYHGVLFSPDGENAARYIGERRISKRMVTRFGLGAAPDSWNALGDAMQSLGYKTEELLDAGLVRENRKTGGCYDTFRNRLVFPVIDVRGAVIGFSGRILGGGEPKYLNSPDTQVFSKSRNLFALNIAKKSKAGMLILTEGNIDVIALHQAGFDCAVASLGTALSDTQVRLMARYADKLVIAFDSDGAGEKAAARAIRLTEKTGMGVRLLRLRDAKDPDEYINKFGADAFRLLVERSENHITYRLGDIKRKYNIKTEDGRIGYLSEATRLLADIRSRPEREVYGARLAEETGVSSAAVASEIAGLLKRNEWKQKRRMERSVTQPAASAQPADRAIRYENEYSAIAEEGVIRCILLDPPLLDEAREAGFNESEFSSPFLAKAYGILRERNETEKEISPAALFAALEPAEAGRVSAILQKPESIPNGRQALRDYIEKIRTERLKMKAKAETDILAVYSKYKETKGLGG